MKKEKIKVYLYTRVSTTMQIDGYSLDAQKTKMKAFCDYNEYEIAGEYEDAGKSGKSIEGRVSFNQMMEDIKSGKDGVSYVLVFKLSRFGRNAADVLATLQVMQDFGVNLICVEDGIDSSKDAGKLMISVLSAVAEIERENIRVQTMEGRMQKARDGKWNGGFAPYGYSLIDGKLEVNEKAEYGTGLLKELSKQMTQDFGKGFTVANLKNMRQFYLTFPNGYALRSELSWTHYRLLMRVENENAREFYMQEAVKSQWSTRQLERQINSFFYERLLSSKNKEQVAEEIQTLEPAKKLEDVIRDPYVLEFLGLKFNDDFYESDLEQALITHLQKFLLELGRGFSFVARQKRITFDGRHFRIDLVFYNYILKCFVLIDLKVGDLTHQDLGQMQMYVHYYERELMNEGDNPPIGIVLCADKSESVVKYTLPENETQIFASKYKLYLPSEEELLRELKQEYQALESIKALEENSGSED